MNILFDSAILVFLVVLGIGILLLGYTLWRGVQKLRAPTPPPTVKEFSSEAVQVLSGTLKKAREKEHRAVGQEKQRLAQEVRRLEHRLAKLEEKTWIDHSPFRLAIQERNDHWQTWNKAYQTYHVAGHRLSKEEIKRLQIFQQAYDAAAARVETERHAARGRDVVNLEELRGQGVLEIDATPGSDLKIPIQGFTQEDVSSPGFSPAGLSYVDPSMNLGFSKGGLVNIDFSECTFRGTTWEGLHAYQECNFSAVWMEKIRLLKITRPHQFYACNFQGANLAGSQLEYVLFSKCDFSQSRWDGAHLKAVKFVDCNLSDAQWHGVDLSHCRMDDATLVSADLSHAIAPPFDPNQDQENSSRSVLDQAQPNHPETEDDSTPSESSEPTTRDISDHPPKTPTSDVPDPTGTTDNKPEDTSSEKTQTEKPD